MKSHFLTLFLIVAVKLIESVTVPFGVLYLLHRLFDHCVHPNTYISGDHLHGEELGQSAH